MGAAIFNRNTLDRMIFILTLGTLLVMMFQELLLLLLLLLSCPILMCLLPYKLSVVQLIVIVFNVVATYFKLLALRLVASIYY
jgi:hypothetical protein